MTRTIYVDGNDAFAVESSWEGVRIRFKKRMALPTMTPNRARSLAEMLVKAANEADSTSKARHSAAVARLSELAEITKASENLDASDEGRKEVT